jgi:hypothetical protein
MGPFNRKLYKREYTEKEAEKGKAMIFLTDSSWL